MKTIEGHTFDETLLSDGVIIDVGCRGFGFTGYFRKTYSEKRVYCIDVDSEAFQGLPFGAIPFNVGISDKSGESSYYKNGEATCLKEIDPDQNHPFVPCKTMTMDDLYEITGANVDILKLDCEGAEYTILGEGFKPIPKQITVEFHRHCVPEMHDKHIDSIIERLSKDYDLVSGLELEKRHGCDYNFWDVLFVKKDLK